MGASFLGISSWEFVIIAVFVVIAFGPDKIPEIFKLLGKVAKMFRDAKEQVQEVTSQIIRPEDLDTLKSLQDPLGTKELRNSVTSLLDPLKDAASPQREKRSVSANASSIWSSLSTPSQPADPGASAPAGEKKEDERNGANPS